MLDPSVCTLKGSKLFAKLPAESVSEIETLCKWQEFGPDESIIETGMEPPRDAVYFVVSGAVRVATSVGQAGEIAFIDLGAGAQFGELSAIDGQARSANVVAKEHCVIASLESVQFNAILLSNPQVSVALLQHLTSIIRNSNRRIVDLSTRTDVQRVYTELLRLSEPDPNGDGSWLITRMPKHKEIAAWAGTTEESVATALGQLIKVGLAKRRYPSLHITDRAKVRLLAELG
ncbi:MAG: Crp/Fnr family transcriptional regulator [Alphaproteobacteria bacterium]